VCIASITPLQADDFAFAYYSGNYLLRDALNFHFHRPQRSRVSNDKWIPDLWACSAGGYPTNRYLPLEGNIRPIRSFCPYRPSSPVTLGDLARDGKLLEVECSACKPFHHLHRATGARIAEAAAGADVANYLVCSVCGARNDELKRPIQAGPDASVPGVTGKYTDRWGPFFHSFQGMKNNAPFRTTIKSIYLCDVWHV